MMEPLIELGVITRGGLVGRGGLARCGFKVSAITRVEAQNIFKLWF